MSWPAAAAPVFGGAPVRLGGGTLDAGNLRISVPNQLLLDGMFVADPFGQWPHRSRSCRRRPIGRASGDIRVGGRFQAMKTVDIRAPT
jgi:hypothetical protein